MVIGFVGLAVNIPPTTSLFMDTLAYLRWAVLAAYCHRFGFKAVRTDCHDDLYAAA